VKILLAPFTKGKARGIRKGDLNILPDFLAPYTIVPARFLPEVEIFEFRSSIQPFKWQSIILVAPYIQK